MRIPSQFNDDSLYRGGKRSTSSSGPSYRRLFRLFVALVLVVLVMREAARPGLYQTFFGDPLPADLAAGASSDGWVRGGSSQPAAGDAGFLSGKRVSRSPADQARAEQLMSRVVDGSVWRSEDADALYFQLATAGGIEPFGAARVAVLPLLQQPDVYRDRPVRFRGTVMRTESVDAVDNEFGIETYWNLWLRPADGGDRPLLAVVEDIPAKIESIVGGVESTVVPVEVEVVGRFFKRLAYRSSIGADLAPVIVGTLVVVSADASLTERAEVNQDVSSSRLIFGIALALLIGLGLAAITVWRTAVTARRARELRQSSSDRSATFLQRLSDIDEVDQDANERK